MAEQDHNLEKLFTHSLAFAAGWLFAPEPTPKRLLRKHGLEYIRRVVTEWRPVNCFTEADCKLALQNYLQGRFAEDRLLVEREYGMASSRVDLVVENEYGIEIKFNLSDESEIKRLQTQAETIRRFLKGGLVVLCGDAEESVVVRLLRELEGEDPEESTIRVVPVPMHTTRPELKS